MAEKNHERGDDFDKTIHEVDELVHEAERVRSHVENSLRNRAFFPDRRRHSRVDDRAPRRPRDPQGPGSPSKDSHAA